MKPQQDVVTLKYQHHILYNSPIQQIDNNADIEYVGGDDPEDDDVIVY